MATPTLPPTMRAWTFNSRGPPRSVLSFNHAFPTPPPPAGSDLLIRISHTALNPGSLALLQLGILPLLRRSSIAANIAEYEFAGTVYLAGPAAPERFKERGTRVFGTVPIQSWETLRSGVGAAAEFMVVKADVLAVMPEGMEMQEAAGLSANGQTALKMCETAGIKPEMKERVLVNGASGGVGTMACQIAKAMGAQEVVGICSGGNAEMVKGLGVDEVVDYRAVGSLSAYLTEAYNSRPFDIILDTIGTQALYEGCPGYLKATGVYINVGSFEGAFWTLWCWKKNTLWPTLLGGVPRKYIMFSTFPNGKQAEKLAEMVRQGKLKVAIDSVVEMEDLLKGGLRPIDEQENTR